MFCLRDRGMTAGVRGGAAQRTLSATSACQERGAETNGDLLLGPQRQLDQLLPQEPEQPDHRRPPGLLTLPETAQLGQLPAAGLGALVAADAAAAMAREAANSAPIPAAQPAEAEGYRGAPEPCPLPGQCGWCTPHNCTGDRECCGGCSCYCQTIVLKQRDLESCSGAAEGHQVPASPASAQPELDEQHPEVREKGHEGEDTVKPNR